MRGLLASSATMNQIRTMQEARAYLSAYQGRILPSALVMEMPCGEIAYVLHGSGFVALGDERVPIQKGATVFIPKGVGTGLRTLTRSCNPVQVA
jgi:mannose-6-phosphate isomerase-like protein (cupin superfamily)